MPRAPTCQEEINNEEMGGGAGYLSQEILKEMYSW